MDIFDLLDRESSRFDADFRRCVEAPEKDERQRLGHALVQRIAAYLLALENVLYPSLHGVGDEALAQLQEEHGRLKWRVADTLLAYCGTEQRAWRSLCKTHRQLRSHIKRLREDLYPVVYGSLAEGMQTLVGDAFLDWLETNRRHTAAALAVEPVVLRRAAAQARLPQQLDMSRIPTLHHVVPMPHGMAPTSHLR